MTTPFSACRLALAYPYSKEAVRQPGPAKKWAFPNFAAT
jgi:hypothetical protein